MRKIFDQCFYFLLQRKLGKSDFLKVLDKETPLTERQCQSWFLRFRFGDFDLKDASCCRRPTEVDDDKIKAMI